MSNTTAIGGRHAPSLLSILLLFLIAGLLLYWQITTTKTTTDPLVQQLSQTTGIEAPDAIFQEAIQLATKNLAEELGIQLENYDLTMEEYEALLAMAMERFGFCEQYRLYPMASGLYPCYSCVALPSIQLNRGQTYKIGQTCFEEKGRYGASLSKHDLFYLKEFEGTIFEVLVAEKVKLLLFRYSNERKTIIKANNLSDAELQLPPGNKILR